MNSSASDTSSALAKTVAVADDRVTFELVDGRSVCAPLEWFPRLAHGSDAERANWRLVGGGAGVHWPDLDEDISVASLLAGTRSNESIESLERWVARRRR